MPRKLETVFTHGEGHELQIDERGRLYWDGDELATVVRLTRWQSALAWIIAISTLIMGIESFLHIVGVLRPVKPVVSAYSRKMRGTAGKGSVTAKWRCANQGVFVWDGTKAVK